MDRLLGHVIRDELRDGRPSADGLATRVVLADALEESGNRRLAQALMRWPRDLGLYRTTLLRKITAAVRGPTQRSRFDSTSKPRKLLLALTGRGRDARWVRVDRNVGSPSDGRPWLIEMGQGYSSYYGLVWAIGPDDAYEIAEEAFASHFFEEIDEDELEEHNDAQPHPTKHGVWLVPDVNARDQTAITLVRRVTSARRLDRYGREARLRTGEIVEFIE